MNWPKAVPKDPKEPRRPLNWSEGAGWDLTLEIAPRLLVTVGIGAVLTKFFFAPAFSCVSGAWETFLWSVSFLLCWHGLIMAAMLGPRDRYGQEMDRLQSGRIEQLEGELHQAKSRALAAEAIIERAIGSHATSPER